MQEIHKGFHSLIVCCFENVSNAEEKAKLGVRDRGLSVLADTWIEGKSVNPKAYGNLVYDKNSIAYQRGKLDYVVNGVGIPR